MLPLQWDHEKSKKQTCKKSQENVTPSPPQTTTTIDYDDNDDDDDDGDGNNQAATNMLQLWTLLSYTQTYSKTSIVAKDPT